jgi:hypothetical protein
MPVLAQVGDDWHRGAARIAHEHLMSSTMRNILGSFLRLYARPEVSPRLIFATLAGERQEIGTLGAACLPPAAAWGSRISVPIFRRAKLSTAWGLRTHRCWCWA